MKAREEINDIFYRSIAAKEKSLEQLGDKIVEAGNILTDCLQKGGKILLCGNGGSAADAQHFAAELINRFEIERPSLPALALTTDCSVITSIGNDYSYSKIFSKQIDALGDEKDVLVVLTTSGSSANILEAVRSAKNKKMEVLVLSGKDGGNLKELLEEGALELRVPADSTARIQEVHILILHCLCYLVEKRMFT